MWVIMRRLKQIWRILVSFFGMMSLFGGRWSYSWTSCCCWLRRLGMGLSTSRDCTEHTAMSAAGDCSQPGRRAGCSRSPAITGCYCCWGEFCLVRRRRPFAESADSAEPAGISSRSSSTWRVLRLLPAPMGCWRWCWAAESVPGLLQPCFICRPKTCLHPSCRQQNRAERRAGHVTHEMTEWSYVYLYKNQKSEVLFEVFASTAIKKCHAKNTGVSW